MKNVLLFIVLFLCISSNVKSQNYAYSWGYNHFGQLGIGFDTKSPSQSGIDTDWETLTSSDNCSIAIKTDGTLWAWGESYNHQLGDSSLEETFYPTQIGNSTNWSSVAMGGSWVIALKTDGTLWAWGDNGHGELGNGTTEGAKTPMKIGTSYDWLSIACSNDYYENQYTIALKNDGSMWGWGDGINWSCPSIR